MKLTHLLKLTISFLDWTSLGNRAARCGTLLKNQKTILHKIKNVFKIFKRISTDIYIKSEWLDLDSFTHMDY